MTKSFDQNLSKILKLQDDTIIRTQEDKMNFVRFLMEKDKEKQLSEYIRNGINTFYKIYENETIRGQTFQIQEREGDERSKRYMAVF